MSLDEQHNDDISDAGAGVVAGAIGSTAAALALGGGTAGAIAGGVLPPALFRPGRCAA